MKFSDVKYKLMTLNGEGIKKYNNNKTVVKFCNIFID